MHRRTASLSVHVPKGAVFAEWEAVKVLGAMELNQNLKTTLMARIDIDLEEKVRISVPLPANVTFLNTVKPG